MREIPAHPAQATAWFVQASADTPAAQCVQLSLSLGERSTPEQLRASWQKVAAVHGMLRSGFRKAAGGELARREHDAAESPWTAQDWQTVPPEEIPQRWSALLEADAVQPIDLANPPLLRFQTILLPGGHCHVLATFPRLLLDEDSLFHLICEWLEALEGGTPVTSEDPEATAPTATPATAEWWRQFFSGAPEPISLKVHPSPITATTHRHHDVLLDRETTKALKRLGQRLGVSTGDILFAAWGLVLGRLTSQRRVLLFSPCRLSESLECGYFENLLPAHLTINGGQSIEAFLKTTARESAERAQNALIPIERVLLLSQPARKLSQFSAAFSWLPPALNDRIHDTYPRWINCDAQLYRRTAFPLNLEGRDGIRIALRLESTQLPALEAEKLLNRVTTLLDDFLGGPTRRLSELRILSDTEFNAAKKWETSTSAPSVPSLEEQIAATISRQPDATAAEGPGESVLTFAELDSHANSLAAWLRHENIADGWNIAVCLNQTAWLPVAVLGSLRAGDTCVPLDPSGPPAWLSQRLDGYDVELVVCDSGTAVHFEGSTRRLLIIDQQWETVSAVPSTSTAALTPPKASFLLAGTESTQPPAWNALSPRAAALAISEAVELQRLKPGSRIPLLAPAGTGAFIETILASLASGATLLLLSDAAAPETSTHLRLTNGQWRVWLAARLQANIALPESLQVVCVDAAPNPPSLLAAWQQLNNGQITWISALSPAGLSGTAVRYISPDRRGDLAELQETPLGQPGPGVRASLRDFEGQPLPPFFPGIVEITPEPNTDKKLTVPGWRDASGGLYFSPDSDAALIRALCEFPGVLDAHVAVAAEGQAPAAWVVLADGSAEIPSGLREHLAAKLSERPQFLLAVPSFPLSSSGEIDLAALPRPQTAVGSKPQSAAPAAPAREWSPLTLVNKPSDAPLLFLIHDIEGDPAGYRPLAALLSKDWTIYTTTARGLHQPSACHTSIESEAAGLVEAICLLDPEGPYHLLGHGFGGLLAFEMARQLRVARRDVPYLAIAGTRPPEMEEVKASGWLQSLTKAFKKAPRETVENPDASPVERAHLRALQNYRTKPLEGVAGLILAADQSDEIEDAWLDCVPEAFIERMSCNSREMLTEPSVKRLAVILRDSFVAPDEEA